MAQTALLRMGPVSVGLLLSLGVRAQDGRTTAAIASVHGFVQGFYDWYTPKANADGSAPPCMAVLKKRKSALSPHLARELGQDLAAQAKVEGEIVGLDFDPFLSGQDPREHYKVGKIVQKGGLFWVDVHAVSFGKLDRRPSVVAVVVQANGKWQFTNFVYPGLGDLLTTLMDLKKDRKIHR